MSYARFGCEDSDVYVFFNTGGYFECYRCRLKRPDPMVDTPKEMVAHMEEHRKVGHTVPQSCIDGLLGGRHE